MHIKCSFVYNRRCGTGAKLGGGTPCFGFLTGNIFFALFYSEQVSFVIQCDPPQELEEYVHRVGRTGRIDRKVCTCKLEPSYLKLHYLVYQNCFAYNK